MLNRRLRSSRYHGSTRDESETSMVFWTMTSGAFCGTLARQYCRSPPAGWAVGESKEAPRSLVIVKDPVACPGKLAGSG